MAAIDFKTWVAGLAAKVGLAGTETLYLLDGGTSKKTTPQDVANLAPVQSVDGDIGAVDLSGSYAPIAQGVTNGDSHDHSGGDGAQIAYSSLSGLPTLGSAAAQDTSAFEASGAVATHAALTQTHGISSFGASLVDDADASAARTTLGLGSAATTASAAYATAAQGSMADSAVQPGDDAADLGSGAATDGYVLTADGAGNAAWEAAAGGGGAFTADANGRISASSAPVLNEATGDEVAYTFNYTTNKATSGNDTGFVINQTDTASPGTSLLVDCQVGGASKFSVDNNGAVAVTSTIYLKPDNDTYINSYYNYVSISGGNNTELAVKGGNKTIQVRSDNAIGFSGTTSASSGTADLLFFRDAAATVAQRKGTNPQIHRLYNSYTDASNYERLTFAWSSNLAEIKTEAAGTGTLRDLSIGSTSGKLGFLGATPVVRQSHIADANTAHALNATFSDTEVEAALNALGTKLNSVLAALRAFGFLATS